MGFALAVLFFRMILPLSLAVGAYIRRNFMSLVYFLLLVILPFVRLTASSVTKGAISLYLMVVITISSLMVLGHFIFQIALSVMPPYGHNIVDCGAVEKILRHVGFLKLDKVKAVTGFRLLVPDIVILVCSVATERVMRTVTVQQPRYSMKRDFFTRFRKYFIVVGFYLSLPLILCAAAIQPSIPGGVYLATFLGIMNWWAWNKQFGPPYAYILRATMWLMVLHMCCISVVQWQYVQDVVGDPRNMYFRIFGLTVMVTSNCTNPQEDKFMHVDWDYYVTPFILLVTINVLSITSRYLFDAMKEESKLVRPQEIAGRVVIDMVEDIDEEDDDVRKRRHEVELKRAVSQLLRYEYSHAEILRRRTSILQKKVVILHYFKDVMYAVKQLLVENSYVAASFAMMAWSITYHSWETFILLLWVCFAWILPPSPYENILRSSPFLVAYAHFLFCVQYIYCFDLHDSELPIVVAGVSIEPFGIKKYPHFPVQHVVLKTVYICTFWVVLSQRQKSRAGLRKYDKRGSFLESRNLMVKFVGELVVNRLAKYWIWIASSMWFAMGFVGVRMTAQRVLYMGLFHLYILNFQLTYHLWRRMLYVSWLFITLISLLLLIIIYVFQFDVFPEFWQKYTKIPVYFQSDLGLRQYDSTYDLVSHMLPMVLFIAVAVLYLHLYHERFLALTDPEPLLKYNRIMESEIDDDSSDSSDSSSEESEPETEPEFEPEIEPEFEPESESSETETETINNGDTATVETHIYGEQNTTLPREQKRSIPTGTFREWFFGIVAAILDLIPIITELIWRFMYLYFEKVAILSIGATCIYDVCPPHLVFLLVIILALLCGKTFHLLAIRVVAVGVSIFMMTRFIYLVDFFEHNTYSVSCLDGDGYEMYPGVELNDAKWFGLHKISSETSLGVLIRGHTGLICLFTILMCARYRLTYNNIASRQVYKIPTVMFPKVNRKNADDSLLNFGKFLINFGFYKFGVEICFIMMAILMAKRLDFYAIAYGFWLCLMVYLPRRILAKVWTVFVFFSAFATLFQYALKVGAPHSMCVAWPWDKSILFRDIQEWMYLPDLTISVPGHLLMCDFAVLMFACHQYYVFRIEARDTVNRYKGGSNKDITHQLDDPEFINPIPDYFPAASKGWMDAFKRICFQSFLWITLSVVFFAGVNRVNLFTFGYLGLTFVYLWHGEKIYLLPTRIIIKRWNFVLLGYNLAVMMIKLTIQLVGCIFAKNLMKSACWAIELLGISCYSQDAEYTSTGTGNDDCPSDTFAGLWWDIVCFSALILMRRFFGSCYFLHLVNETKVMIALADRGAYLFEKYHANLTTKKLLRKKKELERVKKNMEIIIETQKIIQGPKFKQPYWHYEVFSVIRQGDYYMFDTYDIIAREGEDDDEYDEEKILLKPTTEDVLKEGFHTGSAEADEMKEAADVPGSQDIPPVTSKKSRRLTLWLLLKFLWALMDGMMVTLTIALYKISLDYLYVARMLEWMKNTLKGNKEFLAGTHKENGLWTPAKPVEEYLKGAGRDSEDENYEAYIQLDKNQSTTVLFLSSIYYVVVSNSQYACILVICLFQIKSASLMSTPLPLMVFLWAVFIAPRPSRMFWVILLTYTKGLGQGTLVKLLFRTCCMSLLPVKRKD